MIYSVMGFSLRVALWMAVCVIVSPHFVLAAGDAILEYRFEEGVGTLTANTGTLGAAADGTLVGSTFTTDTPLGSGFALSFPALNGSVSIPMEVNYLDPLTGAPAGGVTIEAWINPIGLVNSPQVLFSDTSGGNQFLSVQLKKAAVDFFLQTEAHPQGIRLLSGVVPRRVWTHIAAIYNGSELRVYVNGQDSCVSIPTSGALVQGGGSGTPVLGGAPTTTGGIYYEGLMDDLRVYPRALAPEELADGMFLPTNVCGVCGDGVVDALEQCDPPGALCPSNGASCSATCDCAWTYEGTVWDIDVLDLALNKVGDEIYTFSGGTFQSDVASQMGCTTDTYSEWEVVVQNLPRLRFTAIMSCPNNETRKYEGVSADFQTMSGWILPNGIRTNAIRGTRLP
jgi:hypothetical protein